MTTLGEFLEILMTMEKVHHKEDYVTRVTRLCYYQIIKSVRWADLTKEASLDMSDADDETGLWLPADLACPYIVVRDETDEDRPITYLSREESRRFEVDVGGYLWSYTEFLQEPRWSGNDASITRGTASLALGTAPSTPTFTTLVGEYVRIGQEPGIYEITAEDVDFDALTIAPTFWGETVNGSAQDASSSWAIRPAGTRKIAAWDRGEFDDDADLTIYYCAYPPPLYNRDQLILLPTYEPLLQMVLSIVSSSVQKRRDAASAYEEALGEAKKLNPTFPHRDLVDDHFNPFNFDGGEYYTDRD